MRKCMSMVVAIALVLCAISPCAVFAEENGDNNYVSVLDADSTLAESGLLAKELIPASVEYNYAISEGQDDGMVNVEMDIVLNYLASEASFKATGEIPVYKLSSGEIYMYGALDGRVELAGVDYRATIGFQKFDNDSAVSATLTLDRENTEAIFKFGDLHVKYDTVKEILPSRTDILVSDQMPMREEPDGDYQYKTSSVGQLNGKNAIKETVSYFARMRRVMLTVTPYIQNVENIHTISGTTTAAVSVNRIKMKIEEKSNTQTFIGGLVVGSTSPIGDSGGVASGKNALTVITSIGAMLYPSASGAVGVFNALVNALSIGTKATLVKGADKVSAEYANLNMSNKNWDSYGISVACQLVPFNTPSPTVKAVYNYWSEIRYSVTVTDFMGDVSHVYRTVETSKDYTITTA